MFKRRLRGDNALATPQGSIQSHQVGKQSQVSRQVNGPDATDKTTKSSGPATAMNRLGSGRQSGSTSAATGSRNRLQMKQQQMTKYSPNMDSKAIEVPKHETDLSFILRKRLEGIECEMNDFNSLIQDFAYAVDTEMQNFTANMGRLQKNLNRVHMMKVEDESGPNAQGKKDKADDDKK